MHGPSLGKSGQEVKKEVKQQPWENAGSLSGSCFASLLTYPKGICLVRLRPQWTGPPYGS